jgi:hypothetical protein
MLVVVVGDASPIAITFELADTTVCACTVLIVISRPVQLDAAGSVIVVDALLLTISHVTLSAKLV